MWIGAVGTGSALWQREKGPALALGRKSAGGGEQDGLASSNLGSATKNLLHTLEVISSAAAPSAAETKSDDSAVKAMANELEIANLSRNETLQVADTGSLQELDTDLKALAELVTDSKSESLSASDRANYQQQIDALLKDIDNLGGKEDQELQGLQKELFSDAASAESSLKTELGSVAAAAGNAGESKDSAFADVTGKLSQWLANFGVRTTDTAKLFETLQDAYDKGSLSMDDIIQKLAQDAIGRIGGSTLNGYFLSVDTQDGTPWTSILGIGGTDVTTSQDAAGSLQPLEDADRKIQKEMESIQAKLSFSLTGTQKPVDLSEDSDGTQGMQKVLEELMTLMRRDATQAVLAQTAGMVQTADSSAPSLQQDA